MPVREWTFHVKGVFVQRDRRVYPCQAIVESGEHSTGSPFGLEAVGPGAEANEDGAFETWHVTRGSDQAISEPATVTVYIEVDQGCWEPIVKPVEPGRAVRLSATEMLIDLGQVVIPDAIIPYQRQSSGRAHDPREEIIAVASAMIAGELSLIEGARRLCDLRHAIGASDSALFGPIVGFDSDTDDYPVGAQREGWNREALARKDAEIQPYVDQMHPVVISTCHQIIAAMKHPRNPPGTPPEDR